MLFCDEAKSFGMDAHSCNWHPRVPKSSTGAMCAYQPRTVSYSTSYTVFAQSDAVATIYFITQFLCGFYLRAATNREQCSLNSVVCVKILCKCEGFEKSQFYNINEELRPWFWSKTSSFLISRRFPTKRYLHGNSNPFGTSFSSPNDFTRWAASVPQEMPNFAGQLSRNVTYNFISSLHTHSKTHVRCLPQVPENVPHLWLDSATAL